MKSSAVERWEFTTGVKPYQVTAFEDMTRDGVVTLRWTKQNGKRGLRSLKFTVRGPRGALDRVKVTRAEQEAGAFSVRIAMGYDVDAPPAKSEAPKRPLTITEGWSRASDADSGKWNKPTQHRNDIQRAIERAVAIWGPSLTWDEVDRGQLRKLWRKELARLRAAGHGGFRGAQLMLDLVLAVGAWLRDEQLVSPTAALRWRGLDTQFLEDAGEHVPYQPRYTVDEYRRLFPAAWLVDERYGLLYDLGAEYRLGQVARCRRQHLDRERGRLRVKGRGKKKGELIFLTPAQKANVERVLTVGYLAGLEAAFVAGEIEDYPLFPGGHFTRTDDGALVSRAEYATRASLDRSAWRTWHDEAEKKAEIPHVTGRGPYASRRGGVDGAKELKISREGMKPWGGWADNQMPDQVYADDEAEPARHEAAEIRAKLRGEAPQLPMNTDAPTDSARQESSQIVARSDAEATPTISPEGQ